MYDGHVKGPLLATYTHRVVLGGDALSKPTVLAVLALPAGAIGYALAAAILSRLGLPDVVLLVVPLFVAGLCMVPFVLPYFDRMAKRDLAAHRAQQGREPVEGDDHDEPPSG